MPKSVLIYVHAFAPKFGGVETVVMSLALGLAGLKESDGTPSVKLTVATRTPRGAFGDESLPFQIVRRPSLLKFARLTKAADVIHVAGPAFIPMLVAILLRKPFAVEHHGFQSICPNGQLLYEPTQTPCPGHFMARRYMRCLRCNLKEGPLHSLKMWLLTFPRRWMCRHTLVNITPTDWLAGLVGLPRLTTVYHGIEPASSDSALITIPSPSMFAFVGRLVSTKGVQLLLEAASQLRSEGFHFRLKVVGDGPELAPLRQQFAGLEMDGTVQFSGHFPPGRLEDEIAEVSTVIMPSIAGEVFGMVAAECMFLGKLVVVSDLGAIHEVVGDAGLLVPPGDVEALVHAMKRVLEDPSLPAEFGRRARARVAEQFSLAKMVRQHMDVYRRMTQA